FSTTPSPKGRLNRSSPRLPALPPLIPQAARDELLTWRAFGPSDSHGRPVFFSPLPTNSVILSGFREGSLLLFSPLRFKRSAAAFIAAAFAVAVAFAFAVALLRILALPLLLNKCRHPERSAEGPPWRKGPLLPFPVLRRKRSAAAFSAAAFAFALLRILALPLLLNKRRHPERSEGSLLFLFLFLFLFVFAF